MGRVGVIGGGHAAIDFVRRLREGGFSDPIDILEKSSFFPYERPALSKQGLKPELSLKDFSLASESSLENLNVKFRCRGNVQRLSMEKDIFRVKLSSGESLNYDQVVLATGVSARTLDLPVTLETPVCYLQSLEDMLGIKAHLNTAKRVLIIGAGFIGLEVASSLRSLGHEVLVVERGSQVMNRVLSKLTADFFRRAHQAMGTNIFLQSEIKKVERAPLTGQSTFTFTSEEKYTADLVLVAIGVEPATQFLDLPVKMDGQHVLIDSVGQTSISNLFAIGDVAARPHPVSSQSVVKIQSIDAAAVSAGRLANFILGEELSPYENWVPKFWSDQASQKLQIAGLRPDSEFLAIRGDVDSSIFSVGFLEGEHLIAIEAVNSPIDFLQARKLIQFSVPISAQKFSDTSLPLKSLIPS